MHISDKKLLEPKDLETMVWENVSVSKSYALKRRTIADMASSASSSEFNNVRKIEEGIQKALSEKRFDVIPGIYEGGLKTWECTMDVLQYMLERSEKATDIKGRKVAEIGCGSGLVGIFCLLNGAESVDFYDYNESVLRLSTIPNAILNQAITNENFDKCTFFYGDWSDLQNVPQQHYDTIITCETIYQPENYEKLINLINYMISTDGKGELWVAAKSYYFGVGGSMPVFEQALLASNQGRWEWGRTHSMKIAGDGVPRFIHRYLFSASSSSFPSK